MARCNMCGIELLPAEDVCGNCGGKEKNKAFSSVDTNIKFIDQRGLLNHANQPKQNLVSVACKTTSGIGGAFAFLGWLFIGLEGHLFSAQPVQTGFNWGLAIAGWVGTFIACLLLWAIGEIVNQLSVANHIRKQQLDAISRCKNNN